MKKIAFALAAAAAFATSVGAYAQAAGANNSADYTTPRAWGNSGWTPEQQYDSRPAPAREPGSYVGPGAWGWGPLVLSDGRWQRQYHSPHPRTSRDRDGDGVVNRRDRYPDDVNRR